MAVTIRRPITVKAIVTRGLKDSLVSDLQQALVKLDLDLQQLDFQGKTLLSDLAKQDSEQLRSLMQRLEAERQKRMQAEQELLQKIQAVEALELGQEVIHSTVEADWTVQVGQNWSQIHAVEIVLKDDIVVEIREAGY